MSRSNINNKKTKGKQKEEKMMSTFSKRNAGSFKKANELATLTGSKVTLVIFSPTGGGKPHSFGNSSTDAVIKRFLGQEEARDKTDQVVEAIQTSDINSLNEQLGKITTKVNQEKEKGKMLKEKNENDEVEAWWSTPIETEVCYKKILVEVLSKSQEKVFINSGASSSSSSIASAFPVSAESVPHFPTPPGYE